jgi:uncharacterized phage-associated protein
MITVYKGQIYDVFEISQYVIDYCGKNHCHISALKLQRLLWLIKSEFGNVLNQPCFKDAFVLKDYGPTIPSVWNRFIPYGSGNIPAAPYYNMPNLSAVDKALIDGVLKKYMFDSDYKLQRTISNIVSEKNNRKG